MGDELSRPLSIELAAGPHPGAVLRPWRPGDEPALVRHGGDAQIWRQLGNRFPHPYTAADAAAWIALCEAIDEPLAKLAIVVDGEAVGGVGVERGADLRVRTGVVGYWLGRALWGRGLATAALTAVTAYAFAERDFERLEATVLPHNAASKRVLEKAGYAFESCQRRSLCKAGEMSDGLIYVRLRG